MGGGISRVPCPRGWVFTPSGHTHTPPFRLSYPSYLNVIEVGLSEMILCNHGLSVVIIYVGIDMLLGGLKGVWY